MQSSFLFLFLSTFALLLIGCGDAEQPQTGQMTRPQLSGGPGVSVYDFVINQQRVGTVLVTDGVSGDGYANQYEYWLWDPAVTADLRAGNINGFVIKIPYSNETWSADAVTAFEAGTSGWTAFSIPREFELQSEPRWAYTSASSERFLFEMEAPAWGNAGGTIRYYLEMDFQPGSDIPSMEWLVHADDIKTYYASEDSDDDADEDSDEGSDEGGSWWLPPEAAAEATRWEVRLTEYETLDAKGLAWAYELKTLYPPQ